MLSSYFLKADKTMLYQYNNIESISNFFELICEYKQVYTQNKKISSQDLKKLTSKFTSLLLSKKILVAKNTLNIIIFIQFISIFAFLIFIYITTTKATSQNKVINILYLLKDYKLLLSIIIIMVFIFLEYYFKDVLFIEQIKSLNKLKIELIYDIFSKISYSYAISNLNSIMYLSDIIINSSKEFLQFKTSNKIENLINYFLYTLITLLLYFVFIAIVPLLEYIINEFSHPKEYLLRKYENDIFKYAQNIGLIILFILITFIFINLIYKNKLSNNTKNHLKTSAIHQDLINNHSTLYEYNAFPDYVNMICNNYSTIINKECKKSISHIKIINTLILPIISFIFIILFVQEDYLLNIQNMVSIIFDMIKTNKNSKIGKIIGFIAGALVATLILIFIIMNNIIINIYIDIQKKKYFELKITDLKNAFLFFITDIQFKSKYINTTNNDLNINANHIYFKNLNLSFGNKNIFNNVNIELEDGKHYFITGASGSGKSSLFLLMLGLLNSTSGDIIINNNNILSYKSNEKLNIISYMPQGISSENKNLHDNLLFKYNIIDQNLLENINLITKNIIDNRTKIRIGCLLYDVLSHPSIKIIIMDEPFAGVNNDDAVFVKEIINTYFKTGQYIIINSDHSTNTMEIGIDNILYLGKLYSDNSAKTISVLNKNEAKENPYIKNNIPGLLV